MAEADIFCRLEKLKLTEEKKGRVVDIGDEEIDNYDRDHINQVLCKVLTGRNVILEVFKSVMPKIWSAEDPITFVKAGKNLFLCTFSNQKEKLRVTRGGPWIFDKSLLLFEEPRGTSKLSDLEFRYASFWLHFHGLPLVGFSLKRATRIKVGSMAEETWALITYEKLPDLCYKCGLLGHGLKDCEEEGPDLTDDYEFGEWLKEKAVGKGSSKKNIEALRGVNVRGRGRGRQRVPQARAELSSADSDEDLEEDGLKRSDASSSSHRRNLPAQGLRKPPMNTETICPLEREERIEGRDAVSSGK